MRARLLAAGLLLASSTAVAWVTPADREPPQVAGAGQATRAERILIPGRGLPAGWQGTRDRATGVVAELWGSYVPAPGAVADPAIAEKAARGFIATHLALLAPGTRLEDLVLVANTEARGLRTVGFRQTRLGAAVIGGQLAVMIRNDRVFAATSQVLPDVAIDVPARSGAIVTRRAEDWIGGRVITRTIGPRVVVPLVGASGALEYHVADQLEIEALDRPGRWDVFVGVDGTPLLRTSRLRFAASTMTFDVGVRYPLGARHDAPGPQLNLTVDSASTITDTDGNFSWSGTSAAMVTPGLAGPRVAMTNAAGALATTDLTAQPGTPVRWSLATDEFGDAQLTAYINAMIAKVRARILLPSLASWLDQPLSVSVNENDICNAYSTGDDIHFFRAATFCENTGRLADVVDHEFGHSVHYHAIIPGVGSFNAALSEGLADFFASTILDDPGIGRGFHFDDTASRDLDPVGSEAVWPRDKSADPHITGLIIGGTMWDLRKALIAELGQTAGLAWTDVLFAGVLERSPDIPGTYLAARIADDDDGDLGNGTPHDCLLDATFGKHGLAGAGFRTTEIGVPIVNGLSFTVPTTTPSGTSCSPPKVARVAVRYHVGTGTTSSLDLAASGTNWIGTMPSVPRNKVVFYTVVATFDDGSAVTYPDNPADPEYQLFSSAGDEIWCERFDSDPMWASTGAAEWEWATPAPISVSGDPIVAHTGTNVLGTRLTGNGRYTTGATTSIVTPPIEVWMYDEVHLQYWRWLTIEDGKYDRATIQDNGRTVWTNAMTTSGGLDHVDHEWRFQDVDLTSLHESTAQIAWTLQADMSRELGGWNLDDVCLVGVGKHAVCGDGIVDEGEDCDDGNTRGGDGCSATCRDDGGGCCSAGTDPAGPLILGLGVVSLAARRRRRLRHEHDLV